MNKLTLLFLLFSFTAQAQLQLTSGGNVTILLNAGGGTYTPALALTSSATLQTLDDKAYFMSGNITGAFGLTNELSAGSTLTFSGSPAYTGSTAVTGSGELILTNTSNFRSYNLSVSTGATLTFDVSAYGSVNEAHHVFGSDFTSNFTLTGAGQVNFKGVKDKNYGVYSSTNKCMLFNMDANGLLNVDGGIWIMGVPTMEIFANNLGNLNVADDTKLTIFGRTVQFDKITGSGEIHSPANAVNDMTIKIGIGNGTFDWGGKISEADIHLNKKINIEKMGTGTISFTGNTWQTGITTIRAGTLSISKGDYRGDIINHATLILNQGEYFHWMNSITGPGTVIKKGGGEAILHGGFPRIVGYTGPTIVESGELAFGVCREIKNSSLTVESGATLTCLTLLGHHISEVTSTGNLSLAANSAVRFKLVNGTSTVLSFPGIIAPNGFLIKFSGYAGPYTGNSFTLIKCTGVLPTLLPTVVENSVDWGTNSRKCATLTWVTGTGLVVTFAATGPVITPPSSTLCIGGTQRFTISAGGTAAPTAWRTSNPAIVSLSADGLATALRNGTSVVTYTNTGGCVSSAVVKVNGHVIRPEVPNASFCVGNRIRLKAYDSPNSGTGATYPAWTSEHPLIATVADNAIEQGEPVSLVTLLTPGTATIKFRDKDACTAEYMMEVKGASTAHAGEDKEICAGNSVAIGATAQTGMNYSWNPDTGLSDSNVANPQANPEVTTTYTLTVGATGSQCPVATDQIEVKVNPLPALTSAQGASSQILPAATITLSASTNGTANSWVSSEVAKVTIAAGTTDTKSATATGVAVGDATITYTDLKGCIGTHLITVSTSGKTNQTITFTPIPEKTVGDPDFTLSATSNSNLPLTFISPSDKVIITVNSVKIEKAGKVSIEARQAGNNTYNPAVKMSNIFCINPAKPVISTNNRTLTSSADHGNQWYLNANPIAGATGKTCLATADGNYTVKATIEECASVISEPVSVSSPTKIAQLITFTAIPVKTMGDQDFTLSATSPSQLPLIFIPTSDKVTVNGNIVKIRKAGKVTIRAYQAGSDTYNPAIQLLNTFCIKPAKPSISIDNRTLTSSANHGNRWYLNGTILAGAAGKTYNAIADGSYTVKVTIEECESVFSEAVTMSAGTKANQMITFPDITEKIAGGPNFTLAASTPSNLPITYGTSPISDKVLIDGNRAKFVKAGKVSIEARQAGNDTYNPAVAMSNIFCINPATPLITYTAANKTLTSSADSGNQWYLNGTMLVGATGKTHLAAVRGNYTVQVTIEECISASSAPVNTTISTKATQTITFNLITEKTMGELDFLISASATSRLPVTFLPTSDKVRITGNMVKIVKAGKARIRADQAGNNTYGPATKRSNIFCINPAKPGITYTENNKTLTSSADQGNQWHLNGKPIARATGKTHIPTENGSYTLNVTVEECPSVFSDPVSVSAATKTPQTIIFTDQIPEKTVGDPDFTVSASVASKLPITYSTTSDKITFTGNRVTIVKAGKAGILATQAGNDIYSMATQSSNTFCINPAKPVIAFTENNKTLSSVSDHGNQWYLDGKSIDGATQKTYTPTKEGNYTLKVTIEDCASVFSDPINVVVTGDIAHEELKIFPNPVHDQLVIELPSHENGLILLFSVAGQNLYSTSAAGKAIISMKDFPVGIYILKIQTAGKIVVRKVVRN